MRHAIATMAAATALALLMSGSAAAQDAQPAAETAATETTAQGSAVQLRPNLLMPVGIGEGRSRGVGLGLDYIHYPGSSDFHLGTFLGGERHGDGAWRAAGGLRGGFGGFALQLGAAHRTEANGFAATTGIQLGKTITWGPLGIGTRLTIPVHHYETGQDDALRERDLEFAVVLSLGWSLDIKGNRPAFSMCGSDGWGGHGDKHGHGGGHHGGTGWQ